MEETNIEKLGFKEAKIYTLDELTALKVENSTKVEKASFVDKLTGEVFRCRTPFTSGSNVVFEVNDGESLVDDTLYESLSDTMAKMTRAEAIRKIKASQSLFDTDDDEFDYDPTSDGSFDLADVPELMEQAKIKDETIKGSQTKTNEQASEASEPASEASEPASEV